jgi:chromosome segregation ATPase
MGNNRTFGRVRPDPLAVAGRRVEIAQLEQQIAALGEERRRAAEHLQTLEAEQGGEATALKADRAKLAALDALARMAGGRLPDAAEEEERRRLQRRLVDRPASLAAALAADMERLDGEITATRRRLETEKQQLAAQEQAAAEFAAADLERDVDAVQRGVASPAQQQRVSAAGRWPR